VDSTASVPVAKALAALELARAGRFAEIQEMFAPQLHALVSADALRAGWTSQLDPIGPLRHVGAAAAEAAGPGAVVVRVSLVGEHGAVILVISVNAEGWLTGLQLAPASAAGPATSWEPPDYADPAMFDEREVTLGTGSLAVPGTLSLPRHALPLPAVALLGGSGAVDRDETLGPNKLFKDLAWGLASRGIVVLRFDKVTHANGPEVAKNRNFTPTDEYVPDATAAVRLLCGLPAVDPRRVFVLGHSLGGTLAPRVVAAEPAVAGLVILAGGTRPMHWAVIEQVEYIASLDPATAAAAKPTLEAMTKLAQMVDSPDLSNSTPVSELPFGVPAAYWLDLRGYNPAAAAAALGKPMLILQGGRDYQATVAEDLAGWRASLEGRAGVTIRVYEADNHFFFSGTGRSSPTDYLTAQHADPRVVTDIAAWLTSTETEPASMQ
jgi:dienelactone hydrolase